MIFPKTKFNPPYFMGIDGGTESIFHDHSRGGWPREFHREIGLSELLEKFPL